MELTASDQKNWLKIALRKAQSSGSRTVTVEVCFQNVADQPHVLAFSNRSRKAELLSLRVFSENGRQIVPERRDVILLKHNNVDEHLIPPHGEWCYELSGELRDGYLEFQGAAYNVQSERRITCSFEFQEIGSNLVSVDVAGISTE